jgi:hypothetical protein
LIEEVADLKEETEDLEDKNIKSAEKLRLIIEQFE